MLPQIWKARRKEFRTETGYERGAEFQNSVETIQLENGIGTMKVAGTKAKFNLT